MSQSNLMLTSFVKDLVITVDHRNHGAIVDGVIQDVFRAVVTRAEDVGADGHSDVVGRHQIVFLMGDKLPKELNAKL